MSASRIDLTVGVPTFLRPEPLLRCVHAVLPQVDEAVARGTLASAQVLVIDNSVDGSARAGIADLVESGRVRYVHEPTPGIAAARNRALTEAGTDLLAFIDDDEVPREGWLETLLGTWRDTGADAVMGRVNSVFERDPDAWITAGHVFGRERMPTGTVIPVAAAGNLLLDLNSVHRLGVRFDGRFGLTGGEDTLFSRQLVAAGGTIVWCDESVADDRVPAHRFARRWMMRRFRSHGNITVHVDILMAHGPIGRAYARVRGVVRGAVRIVAGGARFVGGLVARSDHNCALGMRTACRGAGMITAAFGAFHQEYQRAGVAP
jgi:succinoglycan biosynthesis protein ExoM